MCGFRDVFLIIAFCPDMGKKSGVDAAITKPYCEVNAVILCWYLVFYK